MGATVARFLRRRCITGFLPLGKPFAGKDDDDDDEDEDEDDDDDDDDDDGPMFGFASV